MEKRVRFKSAWLPWLLVAPQMAIVLVFFFWPAGQTLYQSVLQEDAFGASSQFVGWANFEQLWNDPSYLASARTTAVFSILVAVFGICIALLLAVMANRVVRGALVYRTLLIWPYAVAPVVAGLLWLMMFASPWGVISHLLQALGYDWNHLLNSRDAMTLIVIAAVWKQISYNFLFFLAGLLWLMMFASPWGVISHLLQALGYDWNHLLNSRDAMTLIVMAAVWKQISYNFLFFLAGLQSVPSSVLEAATIDGATPWRRFWTIVFPLLSPTTFFLLVMNVIYAFFDTFAIVDAATHGGPGKDTAILVYRVYYDGFKALDMGGSAAQSAVLMAVVILLTVFQFRFVEKKVQY